MRKISRFKIATIVLGLGFAACAADEPVLGDEIAGQSETPEIEQLPPELSLDNPNLDGTFQGNEFQTLTCNVKLVYCRDPRYTPHYPSYCSNGCTVTQRQSASRSLCRQVCGDINCSTMYYLGGC
jgi:hypothetical protein